MTVIKLIISSIDLIIKLNSVLIYMYLNLKVILNRLINSTGSITAVKFIKILLNVFIMF